MEERAIKKKEGRPMLVQGAKSHVCVIRMKLVHVVVGVNGRNVDYVDILHQCDIKVVIIVIIRIINFIIVLIV